MRGGAIAGLLLIALTAFFLARASGRLRAFFAELVGPEAAAWALVFVWVAYVYSALAGTVTALDFLVEPAADPAAIAFGRGAISQSLLPFADRFMQLAQLGVLVLAALLFYRGVRAANLENP